MIKRLLFTSLITLLFVAFSHAQLLENFEQGEKSFYGAANVELSTGTWFFNEALLGTAGNDVKNGQQSVRIRANGGSMGILQMGFDYPEGANEISFFLGKSNFSGSQGANSVLDLQYSNDGGSNWIDIDRITAPADFELFTYPLAVEGDIRFRFLTVSGDRMNIDDLRIEPFAELNEDPTVEIRRGNDVINENSTIEFPAIAAGGNRTIDLQIINVGEPDLTVTGTSLSDGAVFTIVEDGTGTYESRNSGTISISFSPPSTGSFNDQLTISSNDPNSPEFTLNLEGSAISEDDVMPIVDARALEFGTRVTVAGRVSVADEFDGPVFIQDETAGIAVFYAPMHSAVQRGDSVIVTGPVSEFNPIGGEPRTFLRQIASYEGDTDISFEIVNVERELVQPKAITLLDMNAGGFESQLVTVSSVGFVAGGVFQGGQNYNITDPTDAGQLRIDQNATDLVNASIPTEPTEITGVVDRFSGTYQLKPRDSDDIEIEVFVPVGEDIPMDKTFDVVTWNIEWFGSAGNGPEDLDLQMNNVITVVKTIDADLYALQEIANETRFFALVDSLEEYSGFWADYSSQSQNTAYLFKTAVVDSVDSGLLTTLQQEYDWAFRLPLFFEFDATVEGQTRRIRSYNVHAKALADQESYNRRSDASLRLKVYLDSNRPNDNVLFIGDYNDKLNMSTFNDLDSPYQNFVNDDNYFTISKSLEDKGFASYIAGQNRSMIDHITVTNDLILDHINGAERVENPNYIGSYISTTSDHAPVWTRFDFTRSLVSTEDTFTEAPSTFELDQNYPNPFNPTTNIRFSLSEASNVTVKIYDVMGREVASVANAEQFTSGSHTITFDASNLSSGMYIYRVTLANGASLSRKMMLIK